jgi:DNA-binding response OmpR family regulator
MPVLRFESPFAVVIEPSATLAETVSDVLERHGYSVAVAATHVGGASAAEGHFVAMLVAAVPAPGESLEGAYLAEARESNPDMLMIVMLSDPTASLDSVPPQAAQVVKPFSVAELERTIALAHVRAHLHGFSPVSGGR